MLANITNNISHTYVPVKALLIYLRNETDGAHAYGKDEIYVESYDIGRNGNPVNAHPLSQKETREFGEILRSQDNRQNSFFKCRGILPVNLLYVDISKNGFAVWYTPPMERHLFFKDDLAVPSGVAKVPAMAWERKPGHAHRLCTEGKPKARFGQFPILCPLFQHVPRWQSLHGNS